MLQLAIAYAHNIELILGFMSAFGALLIWHLPRYRSLAMFFLFQAALMLLNLTEQNHRSLTGIFLITPVFTLAKGPMLYLFVRSVVNETRLQGWLLCWHFLPMVLAFPLTVDPQFVLTIGTVSQVIYLFLCFRLFRRYHQMARKFRSDAQEVELTWVVYVFRLFIVQILTSLARLNLQPQLDPLVAALWFGFDLSLLACLSGYMLYRVLWQPLLYDNMLGYEQVQDAVPVHHTERELAEAIVVFRQLDTLVTTDCLYRQPRLAVEDIAETTGLQMKDISWAINLGSGRNFNEYINHLRIEEVKRQLEAGTPGRPLLELAFAAGFNSKSTFNAVFKRETGMTPSRYIATRAALTGLPDNA